MGTQDPRTHLLEKLAKVHVCMLTTAEADGTLAVSYTHLTLPTILLV